MSDTFAFDVRTDPTGAVCVVELAGKLDPDVAEPFGEALSGLFDAGRRRFVLDLSRLVYVGSLGLRAFLTLHNRLKAAGGAVVLAAVSAPLQQILDLTRVNVLLRRYPTVGEATDAVRSA
jgi:anti-sigma B factor antagonist/stage II sporulation protein AA (anti-sigma F factor antagonist)